MIYREFIPSFPLSEFTHSFYFVKGDMGTSHRDILPDFKTDVVLLFGSQLQGRTGTEPESTFSSCMISGFRRSYLHFSYNGQVEMLGIRFLPFGFTQLFGIHPEEIRVFRHLSDVLGRRETDELMERVYLEPEVQKKFAIVESWLMKTVAGARIDRSLAVRALHRISATHGIFPLQAICNNSPSEYKQLQRFCHREMDICPKKYSRMIRFEHIHNRLRNDPRPDWLSLVAGLGFTDQSHLIREIRQFTGLSPRSFLAGIDSFV